MSKYDEALKLYRTTDMTVAEICRQTDTPERAFRAYLHRKHRELVFARHGIEVSAEEASKTRLRQRRGQSPQTQAKYKDAIEACSDPRYLKLNISQIAHKFHISPTGLAQQLRNHFPEIVERRERARLMAGVNDHFRRGTQERSKAQYAEAIEHLRSSDDTIAQTAEKYNLSYSGLKGHLLHYHQELAARRDEKRVKAKGVKKIGELTGNGTRHAPREEQTRRYEEAAKMYRETAMTMKDVAEATGTTLHGLKNYLRLWHPELALERRGVAAVGEEDADEALRASKQYLKSTAAKYEEAIAYLKKNGGATAEAAKQFNLHPESFREYLYEHEPQLAARLGMTRLANGKLALARSVEKYKEAVEIYRTSAETLKSIAERLGIAYNSIGGFVRRNYPEVIEAHEKLVEEERGRRQEQASAREAMKERRREEDEKQRIAEALKQTGGNKREAAKVLGMSRAGLYNKLKSYGMMRGILNFEF